MQLVIEYLMARKQRTEEDYYNESRRLRAETMLMADALRDNPLRFTVTNGITMDVEVTSSTKPCSMLRYKTCGNKKTAELIC